MRLRRSGLVRLLGVLMTVRVILVSAVIWIGVAAAMAETVNTPICKNDLAATWAKMEEMLGRLKSVARAGQDVKCDTYRRHAEVVVRAREVLERCKTGRDRVGDLAHMDGALDDVNLVIHRECTSDRRAAEPYSLATEPSSGDALRR
jgi:hypothetical protein